MSSKRTKGRGGVMNDSRAGFFQVLGKEAGKAMRDCLGNPVLLRNILEHISSKELLRTSLVNKLWKSEAQSVLRNRGNLFANLRRNLLGMDTCEAVGKFILDLPKLKDAPLSGISFGSNYDNHMCSVSLEALAAKDDMDLLDYLSLKSVSVEIAGPWRDYTCCESYSLAKKVLQEFCGVIEELELNISHGQGTFIANVLLDCNFPSLKILKVFSWPSNENKKNYLKAHVEKFPNIEKLDMIVRGDAGGQVPFGSIWNWSGLKQLQVQGYTLPTTGNLDSVFCGIFPEEVAELRLKDEDFLKTVNIVPVMPAVTCLKNLRTLSLQLEHHRHGPFGNDATFLFSKVTALLAFARMPALAVSLQIRARAVPRALTHLEPYMAITMKT